MAVPGDHLVVIDPCATERLLDPPAWMYAGPRVIAMTDEQRRSPCHFCLSLDFTTPLRSSGNEDTACIDDSARGTTVGTTECPGDD